MVFQKIITLNPKPRGFHLVTSEILSQIDDNKIKTGIAHIYIMHTSAGLTINENADPTVRGDFETYFNRIVPEDMSLYRHTAEGPDDMTSHIKSVLTGSSVTVPVRGGYFSLGTWQGIYLCEFRNRPRQRRLTVTIIGDENG